MTGGSRPLPVAGLDRLPESAPVFQRVAIVGLGFVGGSLAMGIRQAWRSSLVIGVDHNAALEMAMRLHAVDVGADDLVIAREADLVVLAGPPDDNLRVMPHLADAISGDAAVLAIGGASRDVSAAGAVLPGRMPLAGARPLLESPASGLASARPDAFRGCTWLVWPAAATGGTVDRLLGLLRAIGGEPMLISAEQYDRPGAPDAGARDAV
jgi:prephenate dehydrogenase